jgi:CBS domain-containing protein
VDLSQVTVAAVMDGRPLFVGPEMDLNTAIDLLEEWQVRRLPVCVGSRLVGIVSRRDILETLVESGRQAAIPVG